jgi:glycosyltransferase involved in cell wall biosynthesis
MPIYNSADFIGEAIESVLAQRFSDFELIIVDDGSTDGTAGIAAGYAARDERVILKVNQENLGMVANWNSCIRQARGRYLKYLFGDDLLQPDALGRMVEILERAPDVSLVASGRAIIDEESRHLEDLVHFDSGTYDGAAVIRRCISEQLNLVGEPSAVMFRKSQAARGYDPAYRQMVDLEMWYHLLEKGRFAYLEETLCSFRKHSAQQTQKNEKNLVNFSEFFLLSESYLGKPYIGYGRWGARWFLFERYYTFWKIFKKQDNFRDIAREIIDRQYGRTMFNGMMMVYKLYNPWRKLFNILSA